MSDPKPDRDRVIADSGWGIKPDDQPANAAEAKGAAARTFQYDPSASDIVRQILLAQRRGFNTANRVRVESNGADAQGKQGGRTIIIDINKDEFIVESLTLGDENLIALLQSLGAAFNPQELRQLSPAQNLTREFSLSRAWAWGAERSGG